jgi:hypothetical protein
VRITSKDLIASSDPSLQEEGLLTGKLAALIASAQSTLIQRLISQGSPPDTGTLDLSSLQRTSCRPTGSDKSPEGGRYWEHPLRYHWQMTLERTPDTLAWRYGLMVTPLDGRPAGPLVMHSVC